MPRRPGQPQLAPEQYGHLVPDHLNPTRPGDPESFRLLLGTPPQPGGVPLLAYAASWLSQYAASTQERYRDDLRDWLLHCSTNAHDPVRATHREAHHYATHLEHSGYAVRTRIRTLTCARSFTRWLDTVLAPLHRAEHAAGAPLRTGDPFRDVVPRWPSEKGYRPPLPPATLEKLYAAAWHPDPTRLPVPPVFNPRGNHAPQQAPGRVLRARRIIAVMATAELGLYPRDLKHLRLGDWQGGLDPALSPTGCAVDGLPIRDTRLAWAFGVYAARTPGVLDTLGDWLVCSAVGRQVDDHNLGDDVALVCRASRLPKLITRHVTMRVLADAAHTGGRVPSRYPGWVPPDPGLYREPVPDLNVQADAHDLSEPRYRGDR